MSQSRPQNSLSHEREDELISQNESDSQSIEQPNKPRSRQPGRPRGRGRPKANQKGINKKKTSQEENQEQAPKVRERGNIIKEQHHIEPYVRIVDYLKKIDCDEVSFQNKMNPYHSLTANCFWYMISAEYFSYDFYLRNNPLEAANQVLNRVSKLPIPMPTRFIKNTRQGSILEFQTDQVKKEADQLTDYLAQLIPTPLSINKNEMIQKKLSLSTVTEDNQFVSSTRAVLFNYIKSKIQQNEKWSSVLKGRLQVINNLEPKQIKKRQPICFDEQKQEIIDSSQLDILSRQVKKKNVEKKKGDKFSETLIEDVFQEKQINSNASQVKSQSQHIEDNMDLEVNSNEVERENQIKQKQLSGQQKIEQENEGKSQGQSQKTCLKQMTSDEVLLSTILNLPLDKVISILESSIPKVQLPAIYPSFLGIPKSDPLDFIFQMHEQEQKYLEYMKEYKKKIYKDKVRRSEILIEEEERQTQFQDAKCQICTDGDYTDDNLIVFCSTCNISLHQRCVGLAKVPAQSWVCDVCLAFGPAGINLPCPLCNVKGGAMKRTNIHIDSNLWRQTNPGFCEYAKKCPYNKQKQEYVHPHKLISEGEQHQNNEDKQELYYDYFNKSTYPVDQPTCHYVWVHYVCSIWVPECYFEEKNGAINVKGIQNIDKKRYKHECFVCKKSKAGACVKCQDPQCRKYYHPECARKKKVYMQQLNLEKIKYLIFCEEHQPLKITRQIQYKKKKSRDEIIKFARMIEKYIETYKIAIFPFKLMKIIPTKSFIQTFQAVQKEQEQEKKPEILHQNDEEFLKQIIIKLSKLKKISVTIQKTETGVKIVDVYQPSRRQMRKCLNKYDDFWHTLQNGENAEQNCKRYDRIIKENAFLKDKMETFLNGGSLAGSTKKTKASQKSKKGKSKGKNAKEQVETLIDEEGGIFCICRKPYQNQMDMIQCEICGEWYHYKCIGFVGSEVEAQSLEFHCMKCMKFKSESEKKFRLQKCIHLFSLDSLYLNYSPPTPKLMSEQDPAQIKEPLDLQEDRPKSTPQAHEQVKQNDLNIIQEQPCINGTTLEINIQNDLSNQNSPQIVLKEIHTAKSQKEEVEIKKNEHQDNSNINGNTNQLANGKLCSLTAAPNKQQQKVMQATITQFLDSKIKKNKSQVKKISHNSNISVKQKLAQLQKSVLEGQYNNERK